MAVPNAGDHPGRTIGLPGGWFRMGADDGPHPEDGEGPARDVFVDPFALSATAVTIAEFRRFAEATGYLTGAEREGASFVFHSFTDPNLQFTAPAQAPWWRLVHGACWRAPYGPGRAADCALPVTHITRMDALAYCQWSGARLPTEAEWEFAARGGLLGQPYPWGAELEPGGAHRCNVWQGSFPHENTCEDGYEGLAPAESFPPNDFGFFNMTGNIWEWTADRFTALHSPRPSRNPKGPLNGTVFVAKGGSHLCHASYCARYRTSSRQALGGDATAGNLGFRVARSLA